MESPPYLLEQVVRVAFQHPFYNKGVVYPLSRDKVMKLMATPNGKLVELDRFPVTTKNEL